MKTYAVIQTCDARGNNRLVDRIAGDIHHAIDSVNWERAERHIILSNGIIDELFPETSWYHRECTYAEWEKVINKANDGYHIIPDDMFQTFMDAGELGLYWLVFGKEIPEEDTIKVSFRLIELRHVYD